MNEAIRDLEGASVESMLDYLRTAEPSKLQVDKARLGLGAFANIQRHRSAENARAGLELLAVRLGQPTPPALLGSGYSAGEESS